MRAISEPAPLRFIALVAMVLAGCPVKKFGEIIVNGEHRELRKRAPGARPNAPETPPLLVIALDGIPRDLLYGMLRDGKLPNLAALLGGDRLAHAYFDETMLSTLPSSTLPGWVTAFTGVTPAEHGVVGNEYFVRETRTLVCPAPVSFVDLKPSLEIVTDDSVDKLFDTPTVYERLRARAPDALVWVGMNHVHRGADRFILTKYVFVAEAMVGFFEAVIAKYITKHLSRRLFADFDNASVAAVADELAHGPVPDVLTVYMSGTDLYAHRANEGPEAAQRAYLAEVIEPEVRRLADALRARNALANRWVIVTADHGHTAILRDKAHAVAAVGAPKVLRAAGFRVRPFKRYVGPSDRFSAVLAYGGAMAYVYLADRSRCAGPDDACPWELPPRYEEDVLAAAEAFARANDGDPAVPNMKGTLDMILVRRPRPVKDVDEPFEVYIGGGHTVPIDEYLKDHPHPTYVAFAARMHDLAVGVHGERAGDVLLLAHNGDRDKPEDRYYFAVPRRYHSWHGSPSRQDSELPFIVAHPQQQASAIGARVRAVLGDHPLQQKMTDVILELRR